MKRMSLRKFGQIVRRVMLTLPKEFKPFVRNLVVDVELEPDPKALRRGGYTDEEIAEGVDILGLFAPLDSQPIIEKETDDKIGGIPFDFQDEAHRLIIYKRPHERLFPDPKEFLIEVRKTVVHELAHHFGLDGEDLEAFENNPNPFGDDEPKET
jgi:predicted Zn-dependent protease with MMP-like domain